MRAGEQLEPYGPDGPNAGADPSPEYRPRWWLHLLLFLATLLSTSLIGAVSWVGVPPEVARLGVARALIDPRLYAAGFPFSLPLMTILLCHELGHYLAARRHGLTATPPFFIPFPVPLFPIGTLGAVIRIKDPIRNRRQLVEVGAAGPIAGFLALLPFLAYGIAHSDAGPSLPDVPGSVEFAEPLVYNLLELVIHGPLAQGTTLYLHPAGMAAWWGLAITLLNMLPFGQLDGGHVSYALFGGWHRRLAWPLVGVLVALCFAWPGWLLWVVVILIMRPQHPPLWDEDLPLGAGHRLLGCAALAIFALCWMTVPIKIQL